MAYHSRKPRELIRFIAAIRGIKFYPGLSSSGNVLVDLVPEKDNAYDSNAILVLSNMTSLGHLENTAAIAVTEILRIDGVTTSNRSGPQYYHPAL